MKNKRLIFTLLLAGGPLLPMQAQKLDSVIVIKDVVVTANKIEVNRNNVPLSISVVRRDEIEASSESALLPVLSERVPGLFVTEKGITGFGVADGAAGQVNIRGVGQGNKVLVLFDGQPQWAGVFGHALPDTYVASDVERVEVIRGPGSLLYGSNAMGGVVNIITRRPDREGRRTQVRAMYGSYNTQKYMVNNGYDRGRFSSFVSLNHDRTDGHRPDSRFRITNGFANLGYRFGPHYRATGNLSLAGYKNHNPGMITEPVTDNVMDIVRGTTSLALENTYANTSGAFRFFYNWGKHKINDGYKAGASPRSYLFRSDDHNTGVLLYQSFRLLPGNSFTVGIDYKNWGGHAWNDSINGKKGEIVDKTVNETAGYLVTQQDLSDKISLNAGVRYEHNSVYGDQWVPQAGFSWRPRAGTSLKGSFSKGFRSPTLRELYISYAPYSMANPDLRPESMLTYEVSAGQFLWGGRLYAELTAFYIDGKNMIAVDKMRLTNRGRFYNKGVEAELRWQWLDDLQFETNYSYLHTNQPVQAAPKHKTFAGITYTPGRFTFDIDWQSIYGLYIYVDKKDPAANVKENYNLLNARVSYLFGTPGRGIRLFVKGENLTATRYSVNYGYPMPKAVVMGGFDLIF